MLISIWDEILNKIVSNDVTLNPGKYLYFKIPTSNEPTPLKLYLRWGPQEEGTQVETEKANNPQSTHYAGFNKKRDTIWVFASTKNLFPDRDDYQYMFENQFNISIKLYGAT